MDYRVESKGGITVLTLNEKHLDKSLSALLKAELLILTAQDEGPMIIDLSHVKTCDSDGLAALLVAQRTHIDAGRALRISGASASIRKLIELSRLQKVFSLYPSLTAARKASTVKRPPAKKKVFKTTTPSAGKRTAPARKAASRKR